MSNHYETTDGVSIVTVEDSAVEDVRWKSITVVIGDDGLRYTYDENSKLICGAKNRSGGPCQKSPITGRNRCKFHGGKSPRGIAHPSFKHGIYSRDVIGKVLGDRYEEARKDETLIQLRDDIAITTSRIGELLERMGSGENLASWLELEEVYDDYKVAHRLQQAAEVAMLLNKMGRIIKKGVGEHTDWLEVFEAQGHKRRMIETERKRLSDMKQMMTSEQAMGMLAFVVSVFKKRVRESVDTDTANKLLADITQDITKYMTDKKHYASKPNSDQDEGNYD